MGVCCFEVNPVLSSLYVLSLHIQKHPLQIEEEDIN